MFITKTRILKHYVLIGMKQGEKVLGDCWLVIP